MKAEIYAKTKKDLQDLREMFHKDTEGVFRPKLFDREIPVYPANVVRMTLEDFYKAFDGEVKRAIPFVQNLREEVVRNENPLALLQTKKTSGREKTTINYRLRKTKEHVFLVDVSKASSVPMVDILSLLTNVTIERLTAECTVSDWERFEKMNYGGSYNPAGVRTGYRPKDNPPPDLSPEAKALYEATNNFGGPYSGKGFAGKGTQ